MALSGKQGVLAVRKVLFRSIATVLVTMMMLFVGLPSVDAGGVDGGEVDGEVDGTTTEGTTTDTTETTETGGVETTTATIPSDLGFLDAGIPIGGVPRFTG